MIKVSELRLNNCVLHSGERTIIYQIERRYKTIYKVNDIQIDERIIGDTFQPIPLTPELLEQCGFEYKDMMFGGPGTVMQYWRNDWLIINRGGTITFFNDKENDLTVECKYLHQLQNLFFALTGTELNIKP